MTDEDLRHRYQEFLGHTPRLTNECWLGDLLDKNGVYVVGHKFMLRLEGTSLAIWRLIDGGHTVMDIAERLNDTYASGDRGRILDDTIKFVLRLEALGLAAWRTRPLFEGIEIHDQQ